MRAAIAALCLACSAGSAAAQVPKLPVYIGATTNDPVGRRLAYHVRDQIGRSGTFTEVSADNDRGFAAMLVTIDPSVDGDGHMTAYTLVILIRNPGGLDYYLQSYVGTCGANKVAYCASEIVSDIGDQAEMVRQALQTSNR